MDALRAAAVTSSLGSKTLALHEEVRFAFN
jgi:hypothetical protein